MNAEVTLQRIPLSQLKPSPNNVRKTGGTPIYKLANSIHAHGLLQNLVVSPNGAGFHVEAGGRRLQALLELAKDGRIPKDYPVNCQVVEAGTSAHEASLAENVARESMHPVDEFLAFKQLADEGKDVAEIAERFGATERHIRQRLKLANVAPKILEEYRKGEATLEQMQILALTDDQKVQSKVWDAGKRDQWRRHPHHLRGAIVDSEIGTDTALGKFVGAAAFEKAGGIVRRDIFGAAGEAWLTDPKLVKQLATEKLEAKAEEVRKQGWAWVEIRLEFDYSDDYDFGRSQDKKIAGAIVTISHDGKLRVADGRVRPEDRKDPAGRRAVAKKKPTKKPGDFTFAGLQRLQAEANGLISAHVAAEPRLALALLVSELATAAFYNRAGGDEKRVYISRDISGRGMPPHARAAFNDGDGGQQLLTIEDKWRGKLPASAGGLLAWALKQDTAELDQLLAFLVAREIHLVDAYQRTRKQEQVVEVASSIGLNLSKQWKPTQEWLATLPRATTIALVQDAAGKPAAVSLEKLTKDQLPAQAIKLFPAGWLPKPLRGSDYALANSDATPTKVKGKAVAKKAAKAPTKKKPAKKPAAKKATKKAKR